MVKKISSLDKAISILEVLAKAPYSYSVTELSNIIDINRTTIYRILDTFEERNFIIRDKNTKKIMIGSALYNLGCTYLYNYSYEDKILEILNKISKETKESVGFAIREGETVVSLYEIEVDQIMKMNYKPGTYYPINKGCYGKCLMAYYDQDLIKELVNSKEYEKTCSNTLIEGDEILKEYENIRQQGYVISDCEVSAYAVGVGIPIFNAKGEVKACVATSFVKGHDYKEKVEFIKNLLLNYSKEFTKYIP